MSLLIGLNQSDRTMLAKTMVNGTVLIGQDLASSPDKTTAIERVADDSAYKITNVTDSNHYIVGPCPKIKRKHNGRNAGAFGGRSKRSRFYQ